MFQGIIVQEAYQGGWKAFVIKSSFWLPGFDWNVSMARGINKLEYYWCVLDKIWFLPNCKFPTVSLGRLKSKLYDRIECLEHLICPLHYNDDLWCHLGKGLLKCWFPAFSPFPTIFSIQFERQILMFVKYWIYHLHNYSFNLDKLHGSVVKYFQFGQAPWFELHWILGQDTYEPQPSTGETPERHE